ncbi:MAG TPA: peptidylprolyl isomerase [Sedimentisphaerales bacterium]|nr:peptidylprolyl isomerase [Sedimentisphaerales bacterium]
MTLTVNGESIDESLVTKEYQRLKPHYDNVFKNQTPEEQEEQLYDWSRENVIEMVLLRQYAVKNTPAIPRGAIDLAFKEILAQYQGQVPEFTDEDEKQIRFNIELQMKIERLLQQIASELPKPSDKDIAEYYRDNKERLITPESVRVSHIIKRIGYKVDEATALSVMQQAQQQLNDGMIFSSVVAQYSDSPDNDGDLGYIARGQAVEEFEDVIFKLGPGQTSPVFKTRFGFHIAKVYEKRPAALPELDTIKEQIAQCVTEQFRKDKIDAFVDDLKEKAVIEKS